MEINVSAENRLLEFLDGSSIKIDFKKHIDHIFLVKDNKILFDHDLENGYLWCNYELVWSVFEKEYSLDYDEIQLLIKNMMKRYFKLESLPLISDDFAQSWWKDIFK